MSSTGSTPEKPLRPCPYVFILGCGDKPGSDADGFVLRFVNSTRQLDCTQSEFVYGTADVWEDDCRVSAGRFVRRWLRTRGITFDDRRLLVRSYQTEAGQIAVAGYVPKSGSVSTKPDSTVNSSTPAESTGSDAAIVFAAANPSQEFEAEATPGTPGEATGQTGISGHGSGLPSAFQKMKSLTRRQLAVGGGVLLFSAIACV